jgi:ankyrin repeat protein
MRLLKQALKDQQWAIVKLLLQKMDLTAIKVEDNIPQDAPIVIASSYGNESTVQALLEAGAAASQYALETACRGGHDKVVKMLLEAGASPEGPNLTDASKAGHERVVQLLLQADADAAVESLELACRGGHDKVVKILLEAGAKPSHSCLLDSSGAGHERVVELLLQADADALRQSLELACQRGHDGVVKILLDAGAELPNFGLFEASRAGHERVVQLLLPKASAVPSRYVKYAFCQAVENGLEGIVALFLQADVGIDAWAVEALCIAFRRVHLKVAKLLIDSGVDVREARRQLVADGSVGGPEHIEHLLVAAGCHMSWEGDEDLEPFARVGAAMEKDPPMEGDEYRGRFVLGVGAAMEEGSVVLGTMPPTFLSLTPSRPGSHIPVSATMGGGNLLAQSYSEMARREFVPSGANPLSFSDYDSDPDSRRRGRKARVIAQTGPQKAH